MMSRSDKTNVRVTEDDPEYQRQARLEADFWAHRNMVSALDGGHTARTQRSLNEALTGPGGRVSSCGRRAESMGRVLSRHVLPPLAAGTVAAVAALLAAHLSLAFTQPLGFDDAFNLQVPVNLYLNGHYQTWYHSPVPFDHRITTGPSVLLPIAAAFVLFGPHYWVARLVMTLFFLGYLWGLWRLSSRLIPAAPAALFVTAVVLFVFVPTALSLSAMIMGELPALAFFLLAVELMSRSLASRNAMLPLAAGVTLGLAILSKLIILLVLPSFVLALPLAAELSADRRAAWRLTGLCLIGILIPLAGWESVELFALGISGYREHLLATRALVIAGGSGLDMRTLHQGRGAGAHLAVLADTLGVRQTVATAGFLLAGSCLAWLFLKRRHSFAAWTLLFATLTYLAWWFELSSWVWYKHLVIGEILYSTLLAYLLLSSLAVDRTLQRQRRALLLVICVVASCLTLPPRLPEWAVRRSPTLEHQERAATVVRRLAHAGSSPAPRATFYGFGWSQAPEVSFLAQLPFEDLTRHPPRHDEANYLVTITPMALIVPDVATYARSYCTRTVFSEYPVEICQLAGSAPRGHDSSYHP